MQVYEEREVFALLVVGHEVRRLLGVLIRLEHQLGRHDLGTRLGL